MPPSLTMYVPACPTSNSNVLEAAASVDATFTPYVAVVTFGTAFGSPTSITAGKPGEAFPNRYTVVPGITKGSEGSAAKAGCGETRGRQASSMSRQSARLKGRKLDKLITVPPDFTILNDHEADSEVIWSGSPAFVSNFL
ncbi:hypothetical protein D7M11_19735 [Paenibacillus ginsengarvi]|uniref:Uncharacterized protein n=1 Tax=Paenibacillus ginsengarvi TaxID=400777 RepID=A0A3B0CCR2_9BACL|nr:hypothetical protein D7M11_19735 [Paenibacillus ginsengarvi]